MIRRRQPRTQAGWPTHITRVDINTIEIAGYPLAEIIGRRSLPEAIYLLHNGSFPNPHRIPDLAKISLQAARLPGPDIERSPNEHLSKFLATQLLLDDTIHRLSSQNQDVTHPKALFCLGRVLRYLSAVFPSSVFSEQPNLDEPFSHFLYRALTGQAEVNSPRARMLEALAVASVDHGLTPPSTQATRLAASVRTPYEVAVALGIGTITDFHGGAGAQAAEFFLDIVSRSTDTDFSEPLRRRIEEHLHSGTRIKGLGHRIHTVDPRCAALWSVADETGVAGDCVRVSKNMTYALSQVRGISLPVNVDGVIGAVVADMGLPPLAASAVFILGRLSGLSAHYFEEISTFHAMRWINFDQARYCGPSTRHLKR